MCAPFWSFAPGIAQVPVVEQHIYAGCRALHCVARVVVYEHCRPNVPAHPRTQTPLAGGMQCCALPGGWHKKQGSGAACSSRNRVLVKPIWKVAGLAANIACMDVQPPRKNLQRPAVIGTDTASQRTCKSRTSPWTGPRAPSGCQSGPRRRRPGSAAPPRPK